MKESKVAVEENSREGEEMTLSASNTSAIQEDPGNLNSGSSVTETLEGTRNIEHPEVVLDLIYSPFSPLTEITTSYLNNELSKI